MRKVRSWWLGQGSQFYVCEASLGARSRRSLSSGFVLVAETDTLENSMDGGLEYWVAYLHLFSRVFLRDSEFILLGC